MWTKLTKGLHCQLLPATALPYYVSAGSAIQIPFPAGSCPLWPPLRCKHGLKPVSALPSELHHPPNVFQPVHPWVLERAHLLFCWVWTLRTCSLGILMGELLFLESCDAPLPSYPISYKHLLPLPGLFPPLLFSLEQHCLIELSATMKMFLIYIAQHNSYQPAHLPRWITCKRLQ